LSPREVGIKNKREKVFAFASFQNNELIKKIKKTTGESMMKNPQTPSTLAPLTIKV